MPVNQFVNEPQLRDLTRITYPQAVKQLATELSAPQQYLAGRIASGVMADWTWQANVSANQEPKYSHPEVTLQVATLIVQASADFARNRPGNESGMNELAMSPEAQALRATTLNTVRQLLDRRARGH